MNDQTNELQLIEDLLNEAVRMNKENKNEFMTGEKRFKEQLLVGQFTRLHNRENDQKNHFVYTLKYPENAQSGPTPDFGLYNQDEEWLTDLEITEAMDDRERDKEYRNITRDIKVEDIPQKDYVDRIQTRINQKCEKTYPRKISLLVYVNVYSQIYDQDREQFSKVVVPSRNPFAKIWLFDGEKIFLVSGVEV